MKTNQKNTKLNIAKSNKNDEFYTLYQDIEKELQNYTDYFKNKVIYCNCDDPEFSNFWKYFNDNFTKFKIKKLYATYLNNQESFLYEKTNEGIKKTKLKGNGDFRNFECIEVLKKSDIIITNPPFSLIINFFQILIESNKKFIFLSPVSTFTNKHFFKEFKNNNISTGFQKISWFISPNGEKLSAGAIWLTNFKIDKPLIQLTKKLDDLDSYFICNNNLWIKRTNDIPQDYYNLILVPITYLCKHDYTKFELLSIVVPTINDKKEFRRILIKRIKENNTEKENTLF